METGSEDGLASPSNWDGPSSKRFLEISMNWVLLVLAGFLEVGWAVGSKYTEGFTKPLPTIATIVAIIGSLGLLGIAVRDLPVGTAYAVWTGIGTLGTLIVGVLLLGDSASPLRLLSGLLIVLGIAGLKLTA
jgi:quaternary ammonium compound-resistance protein SugE